MNAASFLDTVIGKPQIYYIRWRAQCSIWRLLVVTAIDMAGLALHFPFRWHRIGGRRCFQVSCCTKGTQVLLRQALRCAVIRRNLDGKPMAAEKGR